MLLGEKRFTLLDEADLSLSFTLPVIPSVSLSWLHQLCFFIISSFILSVSVAISIVFSES